MAYSVYYVEESDTLPHLFDSFDGGTGASITMSGLAVTDIEIYKDGGVTQRSSDAGYTLLDTDGIDFDGITGIHGFSIDLSDNTDAGFYAVGSWYHVVISSITVDAQTVNFVACAFRIVSATRGLAGTALPNAAADAAGGLPISDAGGLDLDTQIGTNIDAILTDTGTTLDGKINTIDTNVDSILVDTAEIGAAGAGLTEAGGTGDQLTALSTQASVDTIDGIVDAILLDTAEIGTAGAGLTDLGGMSTGMKAEVNVEVDGAFTTQVADSVAADGSRPTREQALLMITRFLMERSVTSTTVTVTKEDGTTSNMTFELDDATTPTSITRSG